MTEIALRDVTTPAVPHEDPTGGRLVAWAQAASAAHQLAKALVRTSFVPATFKESRDQNGDIDPGNATAAIIMGDELGLSPLASLRGIYVFKGTPALYARTMRALALAHGHEMWTESSTDSEVVVCGRRRGTDHIERVSWTIARATKAGYTNNQKYKSEPQAMLQAKADSEVARKIAADVLAGIPHSVEDMELSEVATTTVAREPSPTRVARRKPAPAPEPAEPEFDEPAEAALPVEELITPAQMKKLHASFNDKGFVDRDDRLAYVNEIIGIEVASSKDLTKDQASRVIDALEQLADVES